jgi:cytochrome c peroxidase
MRHCLVVLLLFVGCQPAARYRAVPVEKIESKSEDKKESELLPHRAWLPPATMPDIPMVFVLTGAKEWSDLPRFWNHFPHPAAGSRTAYLGLPALNAAAAVVMADQLEIIKLKVPLGLPDPAPHIPPANPPTYGKWRLGRTLFYDQQLLEVDGKRMACAFCHEPAHGFASSARVNKGMRNTLSLLNVVYNKQQFWDGRVDALEQVVVRSLEDERPPAERKPSKTSPAAAHIWGGLVGKLVTNPDYQTQFQMVFGIQPTQDSIAKALATYMRTLLSGDSLYDQAERDRAAKGDGTLAAKHFTPFLNDVALKKLEARDFTAEQAAQVLAKGHRLFHGAARCAVCHNGPLFTDQGYHNTGLQEDRDDFQDTGRLGALPVGLKDARLTGAFRTPTLRNLPRTGPYFHGGSHDTLLQVVQYYDHGIWSTGRHLDPLLQAPGAANLRLTEEEMASLVLFLRALDGNPIDPILIMGK